MIKIAIIIALMLGSGTSVFAQGNTGGGGGTVTATTSATAAATPPAVGAGPGAPLVVDLHSSLFVQPTFAGTPVDATHGLPVNCIVGCAGGTASNASSGMATSSTNGTTDAWLYGFNGATWDQIQVDGSKFLKTTVAAALPAGTALIGKVGIDQTTPGTTNAISIAGVNSSTALGGAGAVGAGAQRVAVGQDATTLAGMAPGTTAAGTAPANMVEIGCQYNATAPAATDTQALSVQCDAAGRMRVNAQPATQNAVSGTANTTATTTTSLVGAVASNRIYISAFSCANTGASASLISFQDGSGGTTLWTTIVPAAGGSNVSGNTALFKTTSGNAVFFAAATASTTIYCSAAGYSGA